MTAKASHSTATGGASDTATGGASSTVTGGTTATVTGGETGTVVGGSPDTVTGSTDNGIDAATTFSTSGAPVQIVPDVDPSHPAVDNDPRANTTADQNRIDFNDPTISGSKAVETNLAAPSKD